MKTYQNPQPQAVERADKQDEEPSNLEGTKHETTSGKSSLSKSNKEIYETESEEQAWEDVLKKDEDA